MVLHNHPRSRRTPGQPARKPAAEATHRSSQCFRDDSYYHVIRGDLRSCERHDRRPQAFGTSPESTWRSVAILSQDHQGRLKVLRGWCCRECLDSRSPESTSVRLLLRSRRPETVWLDGNEHDTAPAARKRNAAGLSPPTASR